MVILVIKINKGIDNPRDLTLDALFQSAWGEKDSTPKGNEAVKEYREIFFDTYYKNDKYHFYSSIYDYLTGGSSLNYELLIEELKKIYHIEKKVVLPQYELYDKLSYLNCFSLSNNEYLKLTRQLLKYAFEGKFDLATYMTIFHFGCRFNNPLKLNLNFFEKRILRGMDKGRDTYSYIAVLGHQLSVPNDAEQKDHLLVIRKKALELNEEVKKAIKLKESIDIEQLCYQDFEAFYKKVLDSKDAWYYEPIFSTFSPAKFYSFYIKSTNEKQWEIIKFLSSRYESPYNRHKQEIIFFERLKAKTSLKNKKHKGVNIIGFLWLEFDKILQKTIDNLSR